MITELLVNKLPQYQNSKILGDFNIHIEYLTNADAVIFNDAMRAPGLKNTSLVQDMPKETP